MKIFLFILFISPSAWSLTLSDAQTIKDLVTTAIIKSQEVENAGVSVSVFNKKEMIFQSGFGYANMDEKKPATVKTAFAIGSTTKAFTALSLKLLENRGLLKISDRVLDHLSDFKLSNEKIAEQATIEDLLCHRTGLPRHDLMWLLTPFDREENYRRLQYLSFPPHAEENFRKKFVYNNFMFMVAGKIIEAKANTSYEEFVRENIFRPLGMNETFVNTPKDYSDLAEPHYKTTMVPHRDISDMGPAGSFYSTSGDMAKWIQSFMNKQWENQDDLFKARMALEDENPTLDYGYGLAWMTNTLSKQYSWYFHNGAIDGFSAFVLFSPELDLGAVVLVNQNNSNIGNRVTTELLQYAISQRPINKIFIKHAPPKISNIDVAYTLRPAKETLNLPPENERSFENPGYGVISSFQSDGKSYLDYYGNIWEIKNFEHPFFNVVTDLVLGADHYDFPLRVTNESIMAPFQNDVPMIEFK